MDAQFKDRENACKRQEIAEKQNAEYHCVERMALAALGPGWQPWMKISLLDSDHRETGNRTPVALVYKLAFGKWKASEGCIYLRKMPDGVTAQAEKHEPLFGGLLKEKHPSKTIEVGGKQVFVRRYETVWLALELYRPKSAEELAALRVVRDENKIEREKQEWNEKYPLFANL